MSYQHKLDLHKKMGKLSYQVTILTGNIRDNIVQTFLPEKPIPQEDYLTASNLFATFTSNEIIPNFSPETPEQLELYIKLIPGLRVINLKRKEFEFSSFPESIQSLKSLEAIIVGGNHFSEISDQIFELTSLRHLDFSNNHITEIPAEISQLGNLEILDLSNNAGITSIPPELYQLKNLKKVKLSGTEISDEDKDKFEQAMKQNNPDFELR